GLRNDFHGAGVYDERPPQSLTTPGGGHSIAVRLDPGQRPLSSKSLGQTDQSRRILSAHEFAYVILKLLDVDIHVMGFPLQITTVGGFRCLSEFLLERVNDSGVADKAGG